MNIIVKHKQLDRVGNWAGPRDLFPTIQIDQATGEICVTLHSVYDSRRGQYGRTHEHTERLSPDGQAARITGLCGLRNDRRHAGGRQRYCFFAFVGDSGHIYLHRATASSGWLECPPEKILARLRKLGIGRESVAAQQGDLLFWAANGTSYPADEFRHEVARIGHHEFAAPVLFADGARGRQYKVAAPGMLLTHRPAAGAVHPAVTLPEGVYYCGTTSPSLSGGNKD
jgi:hypothetical protein